MKLLKNYLSTVFILMFIFSSFNTFAHFGTKGPYGGTVTCSITYDTTVYIGTANGGVFESTTSKLVAWRARPVGLKSGKITALTHSGKNLFAATADSGIYIFNGYVGSDRYWKKINNGLGSLKIKSLVAIDSLTLLAGTDGDGVYKTTDKGANWSKVINATFNTAVITGLVKAGDSRVFLISQNNGVFITESNGDIWNDFNDVNTLNIAGTSALSFNATTNELIVINTNGIFRTAVAASAPVAAYAAVSTGFPASTAIRSISNNGSLWLLATDKGVYLSPAASINWTAINTGLTTLNVYAAVAMQTSLVAGTSGEGIFKASTAVPTWVAANFGFNNLVTYSMVSSGLAVVVAATEKGVFVSKDLANSYKAANKGLTDSLNVTDLVFSGTKLLAATKNAGVFISADTGATWTLFNTGLMATSIKKLVASASFIYLITTANEIYVSTGTSWSLVSSGLPSGVKPTSLVFYGTNKVAIGTLGNGIYTAVAGTSTWTAFNTNLSNLNVTSVAAQRTKLFAGTDGNGVMVSDTAAANWSATATTTISHTTLMGLNGNYIQAMATYAGYVWASYKGGLLATSDYGTTWIAGGNQFNLPSYTNVYKIDFVTTRVFVTTEHNSLYSNALSELPPTGIDEVASAIGNFSIYPNPSNGILTIDLKDIKGSVKQVIVYDQVGKKVTSVQPNASIQLTLSLQAAPGLYYVQVISTEGTAAQKVMIE